MSKKTWHPASIFMTVLAAAAILTLCATASIVGGTVLYVLYCWYLTRNYLDEIAQ